MKIVFLTGSHPRHAYMARCLAGTGALAGLVIEEREAFVPEAPAGLPPATEALFRCHFAARDEAEARHFGAAVLPGVPIRKVEMAELNTGATVDFINGLRPHLVMSYGVHKLTPETLDGIQAPLKWNIHGGLSPWYRGVTTHFWPSYFLGTADDRHDGARADAGYRRRRADHQSTAGLVRGDGLHDLAARAVMALGREMPPLIRAVARLKPPHRQGTTGRIWRSADWRPAHLHLIYEQYEDRIVDHYLDGAFGQAEPKLFRQF
ncbi:MAG: hypothetical protein WDN06_20265 [Asticcacaulis sp.]